MSTHDRGRDNPTARRLVLRKIARPEHASTEGARGLPALRPPAARPALVLDEDDQDEPATIIEATPVPAAPPLPRPSIERFAQADVAPPLPPPRPVAQSHTSVPPMVATVITPLPTVLDAPRSSRLSSSWKGVIGGTVLGLGIVTVFVVGARIAGSPARPAAAAAQQAPAPVETAVTFAPQAPVAPQVAVPPVQTGAPAATATAASTAGTAVPVIAATALPPAAPARPVTATTAVARTPPPAAAVPVVAPVAQKAAAAPSAAPAASAASTAEAQAAPEDSAPSLVPVLPPSAPAVVDPLVKAVQDDIKEEQGAHH